MEIRLIKHNELDQLLLLYKHLNKDDPSLIDSPSTSDLWSNIYHDPNLNYLVVDINGQIVASCMLAIIKNLTRNARPFGIIENVVTHAHFRKKGYGKKVISRALEMAWEKNCYKVMLLTGSTKESTLSFYEKVGFHRNIKTGFIAYPPLNPE